LQGKSQIAFSSNVVSATIRLLGHAMLLQMKILAKRVAEERAEKEKAALEAGLLTPGA